MKLFATFILLSICLAATGQTFSTKTKSWGRADTLFTKKLQSQKRLTYYPYTYVDSEFLYTDSSGIIVIIQNSLRKAGGSLDATGKKGYTNSTGERFGYAIFWTRIVNETVTPLALSINLPADSFAISSSPGSYFKLFLPSDTMSIAKEILYSYGATGLKSFLDTHFYKPGLLQRTIKFKEDCLFYIAVIDQHPGEGVDRVELVLQGQSLFYSVSIVGQPDRVLVPCGQIALKK